MCLGDVSPYENVLKWHCLVPSDMGLTIGSDCSDLRSVLLGAMFICQLRQESQLLNVFLSKFY